jgi:hypothetical protein
MMRLRLVAVVLFIIFAVASLFILEFPTSQEPTGAVITRARVVFANSSSCNITVEEGFNLISSPCSQLGGINRDLFLTTVSSLGPTLHAYVSSDLGDPWKAYNPRLPSWVVQDLSTILDIRGYWLYVNGSGNLSVTASIISPRTTPLEQGWNLVGYPSFTEQSVNLSFATAYPYWREVRRWNFSSSSYESFENGTQTGDFLTMQTYFGYWVYADSAVSWVVS